MVEKNKIAVFLAVIALIISVLSITYLSIDRSSSINSKDIEDLQSRIDLLESELNGTMSIYDYNTLDKIIATTNSNLNKMKRDIKNLDNKFDDIEYSDISERYVYNCLIHNAENYTEFRTCLNDYD